ncbi:MAG: hypothetical protein KIT21_36830, partial [Shinella sp.]|nr:hypothetical protein [Shinella sp.]
LGQASRVILGGFSNENMSPEQAADGELIMTANATAVRLYPGGLDLVGGDLNVNGGRIYNNGVNVGHDHQHTNVMPGGGLSGPPAGAS